MKKTIHRNQKFEDTWNFDEKALTYDESLTRGLWIYEKYEEILDKIVEYAEISHQDLVVLDIGIGTGNLAAKFIKQGVTVLGADPSTKMREMARKKLGKIPLYEGHFLSLPFEKKSIDVIVSSFAFHHLTPTEKEKSIQEMKRILKPNGKIIIADLMFMNEQQKNNLKKRFLKERKTKYFEEIEAEYYGMIDDLKIEFLKNGFMFEEQQITDIVWIFRAVLKGEG